MCSSFPRRLLGNAARGFAFKGSALPLVATTRQRGLLQAQVHSLINYVVVVPNSGQPQYFRRCCAAKASGGAVPIAIVKELRDRTGASIGKCKSALEEEGGDVEKAVEWLRKRGVKSMEKRTAESSEALLAMHIRNGSGVIVELRAETDFVTRSGLFQLLSASLASTASSLACTDSSEVAKRLLGAQLQLCAEVEEQQLPQLLEKRGKGVEAAILELGSVLGERIVLGRTYALSVGSEGGIVAGYVHPKWTDTHPGTGKMAAIVSLRASPNTGDTEVLQTLANKLARHVVASQPQFVSADRVPKDVLEKEQATIRAAHMEQIGDAKASKLDQATWEKVIDGRTKKFFQENCLLSQEIVLPQAASTDKMPTVEVWLQDEARALGLTSISVEDFCVAVL